MPISTVRSPSQTPFPRFVDLPAIALVLISFLPTGIQGQEPACPIGWEKGMRPPEYSSPPVILDRKQVFQAVAS